MVAAVNAEWHRDNQIGTLVNSVALHKQKGMMNHKLIASIFHEIAQLLELKGENEFRVGAYRKASYAIKATENLEELAAQKSLAKIPALGKGTIVIVEELLQTGRSTFLDGLYLSIPEGVREMLQIPGLGPKKVRRLWAELGIESLGELEYACHENRLKQLNGFGEKTQQQVLQGIQFIKQSQGMHLLSELLLIADPLLKETRQHPQIKRAELTGELRRLCPLASTIDLLISAEPSALSLFSKLGTVQKQDSDMIEVKLSTHFTLRVFQTNEKQFGAHWIKHTASPTHWEKLQNHARSIGATLQDDGLHKSQHLECPDEDTFFAHLGLFFIPPALREGFSEIELAKKSPISLIEYSHLRGILHSHSTWSDGTSSIEEMVTQTKDRGFSYLQISDHSQAAHYAGGLSAERLSEQSKEIDELQKKFTDVKIIKGIEVDILADGSLDLDEHTLSQLDLVIASVHTRFKQNKEEMTTRLVRAVQSPHVDILGHPTGRLLLSRAPYELDYEQVFAAAAAANTAIEINANPHRLDLDWEKISLAKELGVRLCISPDAHSVSGLDHAMFGVFVAQKGGLTPNDIWNTQEADVFLSNRK